MRTVQSFLLFYILVGFLLKMLGDFKLNKYVRFYGGIIFLLMLIGPVYELFSQEDILMNIELKQMWQEYEEARNYNKVMGEYSDTANEQAVEILINEMDRFLNENGYEIDKYEVWWNDENNIEELELYVMDIGEIGISISMNNTTQKAMDIKNLIQERYEPEFELEVYCSD